jgi:hypothetical protein
VPKNLLLAALSLGFTWLLLELLVVPLALPPTPLRIHAGLPTTGSWCLSRAPFLWGVSAQSTDVRFSPR